MDVVFPYARAPVDVRILALLVLLASCGGGEGSHSSGEAGATDTTDTVGTTTVGDGTVSGGTTVEGTGDGSETGPMDSYHRVELVIEEDLTLCGFGGGNPVRAADVGEEDVLLWVPAELPLSRTLTLPAGAYTIGLPATVPETGELPRDGEQLEAPDLGALISIGGVGEALEPTGSFLLESYVGLYSLTGEVDPDLFRAHGLDRKFTDSLDQSWDISFWLEWESYSEDLQAIAFLPEDPANLASWKVEMLCGTPGLEACTVAGVPYTQSPVVRFYPCSFPWEPVRRWTIQLGAEGVMVFDQQVTGPGNPFDLQRPDQVLLRAEGRIDGVDWLQVDPSRLAREPQGGREVPWFAAMLDSPIGEACGVAIDFDPSTNDARAYSFDCNYRRFATYDVASVEVEEIPFEGYEWRDNNTAMIAPAG